MGHHSILDVSRITYCLVPAWWTAAEIESRSCTDRSHPHLSHTKVWEFERDDLLEWIRRPMSNRDKGIVKIRRLIRRRGLSAEVGVPLADAIRQNLPWAFLMFADIKLTPLSRMADEWEIARRAAGG